MAEQHIICSRCKSKFINDDEHIKANFGYNKLGGRYKTCVSCRLKKNNSVDTKKDDKQEDKQEDKCDGVVIANEQNNFVKPYVSLPLIKFEDKQIEDMKIESIVVVNHGFQFEPYLTRYDKDALIYK